LNKTVTIVIVIIFLAVGGILVFGDQGDQNMADQPATTTEPAPSTEDTDAMQENDEDQSGQVGTSSAGQPAATVTYEDGQFRPQAVTVSRGDTVRFVAADGSDMWVGSDEHPTHTEYDGTNLSEHCNGGQRSFDQCQSGNSFSFTFTKSGEFGYHNHVRASAGGVVVVQ
jgi:plastocyanin